MQEVFHTERLRPQEARLAFHLVRLCEPRWTLLDWLELTRRLCRRSPQRAGLMALQDRRGIFHAIFGYTTVRSLELGYYLRIGDLIVAHLPGSAIDDVIVDCAERLAASLGCESLVIDLPTQRSSAASRRLKAILAERFTPVSVSHRRCMVGSDGATTRRGVSEGTQDRATGLRTEARLPSCR
jgi:hypothetical protein